MQGYITGWWTVAGGSPCVLDAYNSREDTSWGGRQGSIVGGDSVDPMVSGCRIEVAGITSDMWQHVLRIGYTCNWTCSE